MLLFLITLMARAKGYNRMRRVNKLLPLLLCTASIACGAQNASLDKSAGNQSSDIVGGRTTTGFAAVGAFVNFDTTNDGGYDLCTATYLGDNRIITAAHCVLSHDANGPAPSLADPANLMFYTGTDINSNFDNSKVFNVKRVAVPQGFNFATFISNDKQGYYNNNDLAMVELVSDPGVAAATLSSNAITSSDVGKSLVLIGYGTTGGYTDSKSAGVKRTVTVSLTDFNNNLLEAGNAQTGTCAGDSGGPAALGQTLVGLTQSGSNDANGRCVGNDIFTRVDVWQQFIQNF